VRGGKREIVEPNYLPRCAATCSTCEKAQEDGERVILRGRSFGTFRHEDKHGLIFSRRRTAVVDRRSCAQTHKVSQLEPTKHYPQVHSAQIGIRSHVTTAATSQCLALTCPSTKIHPKPTFDQAATLSCDPFISLTQSPSSQRFHAFPRRLHPVSTPGSTPHVT
jgi:hypothetical protein